MPTTNCPYCGQAHEHAGASPASCRRCGKPISKGSGDGDAFSLDLKEMERCGRCGHEAYEEHFLDGACPRCHEPLSPPDDGDDDDGPGGSARGPAPRGAGRAGARPGKRGARVGSGGGKRAAAPAAEKKKVVLNEEFKAQVFAAFRRSEARAAQQLCFELVDHNEEHAKQIYDYLLNVARKKGWLGIEAGAAPVEVVPVEVVPVEVVPVVPEPLPMPPGLDLGGGGPGAPGYGEPLPLPAGILGDPFAGPQPLPLPGGILGGAAPSAPPAPEPFAPEPFAPEPFAPDPFAEDPFAGAPAAPVASAPLAPGPSAPLAAAAPRRSPPAGPTAGGGGDPEPEEKGFLGRVAVEGRAAQVSLLCLAGRYAAARALAQATLGRDGSSARAHAALGEALAGLGDDAQALQAFTSALRLDPHDPAAIRGYAQLLQRQGRYPEAANAYQRIVSSGIGSLKDAVALAAALRRAGNAAAAQRVLEEVAKRDPQSLEHLRQEAEARAGAGDLDGAAGLLERILAKEAAPHALALALAESLVGRCEGVAPSSAARARLACARAFTAAGRPFPAVRLLEPLVSQHPNSVELRRAMGLACAALGAGPLAEEHLLVVVRQQAAGPEELRILGELYLERGEAAQGVRALLRAKDVAPEDVAVRRTLARALAGQGDLEGAVRELEEAHGLAGTDDAALEDELDRITERAFVKRAKELEARLLVDEADADARLELARGLAQRGDLRGALHHLEWAGERSELLARALSTLEQVLEESGPERALVKLAVDLAGRAQTPGRALEPLETYVAGAPDDAEMRLLLYRAYAGAERVDEAVVGLRAFLEDGGGAHLDEAARLGEELLEGGAANEALALSLARTRRRQGEVDAAVKHYRRYLEGEPEDTDARVELGQLLEGAGRREDAYEVLAVLVRDGAGSVAELERLAGLASAAGKIDEAVTLLERALEQQPEDLGLKHALEAAEARQRRQRIAALEAASGEAERLELAGLLAEENDREAATELLRALGRLTGEPELAFFRFAAEHFARRGKNDRAEAALRQVGRTMGLAPGSEQHKALLYRVASLHERAGDRRAARRVYLEVYVRDPQYREVAARLSALSDDLGASTQAVDERVLDLLDVGGPVRTVFDDLQGCDLALDPRVVAQGYQTSSELKAQRP